MNRLLFLTILFFSLSACETGVDLDPVTADGPGEDAHVILPNSVSGDVTLELRALERSGNHVRGYLRAVGETERDKAFTAEGPMRWTAEDGTEHIFDRAEARLDIGTRQARVRFRYQGVDSGDLVYGFRGQVGSREHRCRLQGELVVAGLWVPDAATPGRWTAEATFVSSLKGCDRNEE